LLLKKKKVMTFGTLHPSQRTQDKTRNLVRNRAMK